MRNLAVLIVSFCFFLIANAQQNNTLFLMRDLPQNNIVNPASSIKCKWYLGVPLVASTHVNAYSSGFSANDILTTNSSGELELTPGHAINKMNKLEVLATELHVNWLYFGYKYRTHYFTFSLSEKLNTYNIYSKNLALLLYKGNSQFEGKNVNMDGTRVNANHYREYALGWANEVNENLSFGCKVKFLFGKGNVFMRPSQASLNVDKNTFAQNIITNADAYVSFPVDIETDEEGYIEDVVMQEDIDWKKYAMNTSNFGLGMDVGMIYKINDVTTLSASLLDIGFINWKSDVQIIKEHTSVYVDASDDTFSPTDGSVVSDTLRSLFKPDIVNGSYASTLKPTLYLGVDRQLTDQINVGALISSEIYQNRFHHALSLSGNFHINDKLAASASYTIQNNQFNNLGLGVGWQLGVLYFHAVSDNIPAFFALDNARNINLRFGVGILAGCGKDRSHKNGSSRGSTKFDCVGDPYHSTQYPKRPPKRHRKR